MTMSSQFDDVLQSDDYLEKELKLLAVKYEDCVRMVNGFMAAESQYKKDLADCDSQWQHAVAKCMKLEEENEQLYELLYLWMQFWESHRDPSFLEESASVLARWSNGQKI